VTHTHTHPLGRTPLHKWSARRRGRYKIQTSMPLAGSEPAIPASKRSQTCVSLGTATGIRCHMLLWDELSQPGTAPVTRPCILLQFAGEQISVSVLGFSCPARTEPWAAVVVTNCQTCWTHSTLRAHNISVSLISKGKKTLTVDLCVGRIILKWMLETAMKTLQHFGRHTTTFFAAICKDDDGPTAWNESWWVWYISEADEWRRA
jgi:hypothetical protein